jgi:large subunit ribosomal protein L9
MKVILLTDVPKVGNKYDIKDFKDGYAQNVLLARGLAILATPAELNKLEDRKKISNEKKNKEMQTFLDLISDINNKTIEIKVKANEKGHLFKAVNSRDVAESIKTITNIVIEEKYIKMEPIKSIGLHKILIEKEGRKGECEISIIKN